ncbi:MAG: hypothetical protein IKP47_02285 [Ruminococcus sp.]|nr:hypothetical protein [Ruminococcus sp.]
MNIARILVPLTSVLLFLLLRFIIGKLNLRKGERLKQFRFTVLGVLYMIALSVLFVVLDISSDLVFNNKVMDKIISFVKPGAKIGFVIRLYSAIALNLLIVFGFLVVKGLSRIFLGKLKVPASYSSLKFPRKIFWRVIGCFYDWETLPACTYRRWVKVERILTYTVRILTVIYLAFILFMQLPVFSSASWIPYDFMDSCLALMYICPVVTLIPLNEFRWFLQGLDEAAKTVGSTAFDKSGAGVNADYSELAEQYRNQFPTRFAAQISGTANASEQNFQNDIRSDSKFLEALADSVRESGYVISKEHIDCIRKLTEGEDVLCDASLFSDFGEYLFVYFNDILAQGRNILFLCADGEYAETLSSFINDKFRKLNSFHPVWILKDHNDLHSLSDADILVTTPQLVLDADAFVGQERFFNRLYATVLVNASEMIAKEGSVLALLARKLVRLPNTPEKQQYICLSEGFPSETSNTLRQILDLNGELYTFSSYCTHDNTTIMLWNYEAAADAKDGRFTMAQDDLFGGSDAQTYWGVSVPLACVAMKYLVSRISLISHRGMPYKQIISSMSAQKGRISGYFSDQLETDAFSETIVFNRIESSEDHNSFIIVEDDLCNLPLAIYNYSRFGGSNTTMIHIVSKPYMLRDFFAANAQSYTGSEANVGIMMPAVSDSREALITGLLCEALDGGAELDELFEKIRSIDGSVETKEDAIVYFRDALFPERASQAVEHSFRFELGVKKYDSSKVEFVRRDYLFLKDRELLSEHADSFTPAMMVLRGRQYPLNVFKDRLYQNFVVNQNFVYKGMLYTVEAINGKEGTIRVKEAPDQLNAPVDFIQIRKYSLVGPAAVTALYPVIYDQTSGRITRGYEVAVFSHAHITVDTSGYYALSAVNPSIDLVNGPLGRTISPAERKASFREYSDAYIISLRIKGVGSASSDRISFLLSVMLNEMMKTIFPYSHNCIAVCPVLSDREKICGSGIAARIAQVYPQLDAGEHYSHSEDDAEVFIIEDCEAHGAMVKNLIGNGQFPFAAIFEAVAAYLKWFGEFRDSGNISKKYLYFGADSLPDCFDAEGLAKISEELDTVRRTKAIEVNCVTSKGQCCYCHRELFGVEYIEMKDNSARHNRKICRSCYNLIVTDEEKLRKLYLKARDYLCGTFGITLPTDINVRFATAEKLRKAAKTGDVREVLGFANKKTRELWVEADAPSTNVMTVLVHELTHFWQYDNIQMFIEESWIEGHASYAELQFLKRSNHAGYARWMEDELNLRTDAYGEGFRTIDAELRARGDYNSFAYMFDKFGTGNPPPGGFPPVGDRSGGRKPGSKGGSVTAVTPGTGTADQTDPLAGLKQRNPANCRKYCFEMLNDTEKKIYRQLAECALTFGSRVEIDRKNVHIRYEELSRIFQFIRYDNQDLFWLDNFSYNYNTATGEINSVELKYCYPKDEAMRRQAEIERAIAPFLASVSDSMSDLELVMQIYKNIISLVDYDTVQLRRVEESGDTDGSDDIYSIYGVFVNRKAVCAGYAKATQLLLNRFGIEAVYVSGIAGIKDPERHGWNLIKLEGDYYWLDTTWGDHSNTDKTKSKDTMDYEYFCVDDRILFADHAPDDTIPLPKCTAVKCNYHHRFGLYFTSYSYSALSEAACALAGTGETCISFRFSDPELTEKASDQLFSKGDASRLIEDIRYNTSVKPKTYSYSADKDKMIVSIFLK